MDDLNSDIFFTIHGQFYKLFNHKGAGEWRRTKINIFFLVVRLFGGIFCHLIFLLNLWNHTVVIIFWGVRCTRINPCLLYLSRLHRLNRKLKCLKLSMNWTLNTTIIIYQQEEIAVYMIHGDIYNQVKITTISLISFLNTYDYKHKKHRHF